MVYETSEEGTTRYYYDHMSRLDTAIMKDGNIQQYEYDDFNNIRRLVEIQGTDFGSSMIFENTYAYDLNGRLLSKKNTRGDSAEELVFTYDNEGNQLTKEVVVSGTDGHVLSQPYEFGYNGYNQLESFTGPDNITTTYLYNGIGLRTDKNTGEETKGFYYNNGSIVLETGTNGQTLATNTRGLRLISREIEADTMYYLHNTRGDVTKLTDPKGNVIMDYVYDPFGNGKEAESNKFGLNGFNSQASVKVDNPFRYSGEYLDSETGNYYLRARYYDPSIQRFITEDSYKGVINNPYSLNSYSYCWNDPVNSIDPGGKDPYSLYLMLTEYSQTIMSSPDSQIDLQLIADDVAQGDYLAATLDVVGLLTPGASGYGKTAPKIRGFISDVGTKIDDGLKSVFKGAGDDVAGVVAKGAAKPNAMTWNEFQSLNKGKYTNSQMSDAWSRYKKANGISTSSTVNSRIHGNSLANANTNYGYQLVDNKTGNVLKYGETLYPNTRYSKKYL